MRPCFCILYPLTYVKVLYGGAKVWNLYFISVLLNVYVPKSKSKLQKK